MMGGGDLLTATPAVGAPIWSGRAVGGLGLDEPYHRVPVCSRTRRGQREERSVILGRVLAGTVGEMGRGDWGKCQRFE
jgi:hypothetical protein